MDIRNTRIVIGQHRAGEGIRKIARNLSYYRVQYLELLRNSRILALPQTENDLGDLERQLKLKIEE